MLFLLLWFIVLYYYYYYFYFDCDFDLFAVVVVSCVCNFIFNSRAEKKGVAHESNNVKLMLNDAFIGDRLIGWQIVKRRRAHAGQYSTRYACVCVCV